MVKQGVLWKGVTVVVISILCMPIFIVQAFLDVDEGVYYAAPVEWAVERGLIDMSGHFRPGDTINRAEAAKIIVNEFALAGGSKPIFKDVDFGDWFYGYVSAIAQNDLMNGYKTADGQLTGYFGPGDALTRAAAAKLIVTGQGYPPRSCEITFTDVDYNAWYADFLETACAFGVMHGDIPATPRNQVVRIMRPTDAVNRAEFLTMLYNARADVAALEIREQEDEYIPTVEDFQVTPEPGIAPEFDLDAVPTYDSGVDIPEFDDSTETSFKVSEPIAVNQSFQRRNNNYKAIQPSGKNCSNVLCAVYVAQFEIIPYYDAIHLKKFVLKNDDNALDFSSRFGTLYLVYDKEVVGTASLSDVGGDGTVAFNNIDIILSKGEYHHLNVLAEVHDITRAEDSGAYLKLYFDGDDDSMTALSNANGLQIPVLSITNQAGESDPRIQQHIVRKTVPKIEYFNGKIGRSVFGSTQNLPVYKFNISAHENGDLEWKRLTFNVGETLGIDSSNYRLFVVNSSTPINTPVSVEGGEVTIDAIIPQEIPAGMSVMYVLKSDIEITAPSGSQTLSIELSADSDTSLETTLLPNLLTTADFIWSDKSAKSHSTDSRDWTNGFEVDALDLETVYIGYQGTGN